MGSKRWFRYVSDDGVPRAVERDESNTELVNVAADVNASVAGLFPLPKGIKPRSVILESADGLISRECVILNPDRYNALNNATNFLLTAANFSGVAVDTPTSIVRKNPEIARRQPRTSDSGQLDGDNP